MDDIDNTSSLPSDSIGSRFVSQTDLDEVNRKRDEQWKAAYARLGQEPPERGQEEAYDGRSLAEKLAANKAAAQEEWEQKMKLSNQFRALEEDEIVFLDTIREKQLEEEKERNLKDKEELKNFRQAVAAHLNEPLKPPLPAVSKSKPISNNSKATLTTKGKLKGVIVKRKGVSTSKQKSQSDTEPSKISAKPQVQSDEPKKKRQRIETNVKTFDKNAK